MPVLSPAQIAQLPAGRVVVIRRGMPPAIGRVQMAWKRGDVRSAARAAVWAARVERFQEWREEATEVVLGVLAERWPARFAEWAVRVKASNAMFREFRRRQHETDEVPTGRWS